MKHQKSNSRRSSLKLDLLSVFGEFCLGDAGLKVNDQLVTYATTVLAVRIKKSCVVAPRRLKSQNTVGLL